MSCSLHASYGSLQWLDRISWSLSSSSETLSSRRLVRVLCLVADTGHVHLVAREGSGVFWILRISECPMLLIAHLVVAGAQHLVTVALCDGRRHPLRHLLGLLRVAVVAAARGHLRRVEEILCRVGAVVKMCPSRLRPLALRVFLWELSTSTAYARYSRRSIAVCGDRRAHVLDGSAR